MARFTTRVQLNGEASWEDYDNLHVAMRNRNFAQTITSGEGVEYHLPHAEYNRDASLTIDQVLNSAKEAAASVWDDFSILVTESNGRKWHNLAKVR
jgi:hypothetical protein